MSRQTPTITETAMRTKFRRRQAPFWLVFALCMGAGMFCSKTAYSQYSNSQYSQQMPIPGRSNMSQLPQMTPTGPDAADRSFQRRRVKAMNKDRQKKLVSDANKLLKLTAQLNAQISRGRKDSFTPDQLRMLARIEKLAKSVKDKMSYPIGMPVFGDNFPPTVPSARFP